MASLASLYERLDRKRRELRTYRDRLDKVRAIRGDMAEDFDNNVEDAINKSISVCEFMQAAVSGDVTSVSNSVAETDLLREKFVWSDTNMSASISYLDSEISRCQREISRLESEIRSIQRQIEAARRSDD